MDSLVYAYVSALGLWFSWILIKFVSNKIYLSLSITACKKDFSAHIKVQTVKNIEHKVICVSFNTYLSNKHADIDSL